MRSPYARAERPGGGEAIAVRGALLWYAVPGVILFVAVYLPTWSRPADDEVSAAARIGESASGLKSPQPTAPAVRIPRA